MQLYSASNALAYSYPANLNVEPVQDYDLACHHRFSQSCVLIILIVFHILTLHSNIDVAF